MDFSKFSEQQIRKAQREGQLDNLPGAGKPLNIDRSGDAAVDTGFRLMHEAGVVPKEIELKKALQAQAAKLQSVTDPEDVKREMKIFADLQMQLNIQQEARRKFLR